MRNETVGCTIELYSLASEEAEHRERRKQQAQLERRRPTAPDEQERLVV